jgi:hypothetical protein
MKKETFARLTVVAVGLTSLVTVDLDHSGSGWNVSVGRVAHAAITVTKARIGCLDRQTDGNLTTLVEQACNNKSSCSFKAPTEDEYRRAGVRAQTRPLCSQAMEISYRCGQGDVQTVFVPGHAWDHPPAQLICDGATIATNRQNVSPPNEAPFPCTKPVLNQPDYWIAPRDMLDWTPTQSQGDYTLLGFKPPQPATRAMYNSPLRSVAGAPGSTLGANEGRLRAELRASASSQNNPIISLCNAAQRFTRNRSASANDPSDQDLGNAFADLSVTGKATFARFVQLRPSEASLRSRPECAGASASSLTKALNRAYQVTIALRGAHDSPQRRALKWIAVSGEDDQPYRPVNVPSTNFPQFHLTVNVPGKFPVNTRYMIAHAQPPSFQGPDAPLLDGGLGRRVSADLLPALAPDARVILFIHGMDSHRGASSTRRKELDRDLDGPPNEWVR